MGVINVTGTSIVLIVCGMLFGGLLSGLIVKKLMHGRVASTRNAAKRVIEEAQKEAETLKKEAIIQAKDSL